jgi:hypothetical protein
MINNIGVQFNETDKMEKCHICNKDCDSLRKLSKHIRDTHKNISIKDYYDSYLKKENEGLCVICGNKTNYRSIGEGYQKTCSHKCGCIHHRQQLKNDPKKQQLFIDKLSKLQTDVWRQREITGQKEKIMKKAGETSRANNNKMTQEERNKKFNWRLKATDEQLLEAHKKQCITKGTQFIDKLNTLEPESWVYYNMIVRYLTEINYKKYKHIINPLNLKRSRYEYNLDHIFSVAEGFVQNISPEIIASVINLQMLSSFENCSKNSESWMSKEELLEKWEKNIIKDSLPQKM